MAEPLKRTDPRWNLRCWITRRPCGCVVAICADEPKYRDGAAEFVAEEIRAGRTPENVLFREVVTEETFCKCPHKTAGKQLEIEG